MSFRALFWNIENFEGDDPTRLQRVTDHIQATDPDILGFSEIRDKAALRNLLFANLTDYDFGITDGDQGIELVAGWRRGMFDQALYTQRREFKSDNPFLRPGALLSVRLEGLFYNFLFLHTDSGRTTRDYDNRQDMFEKIWSLNETLGDIDLDTPGETRFIVMGDLNTMGRSARAQVAAISGAQEVEDLANDAQDNNMAMTNKTHPKTWADVNNETGELLRSSDLDHVLVSKDLPLGDAGGSETHVRGWVDIDNDPDRRVFVEEISDHASIEVVVTTPGG
ncbi:MAG: endonuclease/exonuclease/phosphatase family protein [Pseudomonadota bacterium]